MYNIYVYSNCYPILLWLVFLLVGIRELLPSRILDTRYKLSSDKYSGPLLFFSLLFEIVSSVISRPDCNNSNAIWTTTLLITGLLIRIIAQKKLGKSFSYRFGQAQDSKLVTTGIYTYVRHPAYLGTILYATAFLVFSPRPLVVFAYFLTILSIWFRINLEEVFLQSQFGEGYLNYKKTTKKIIPLII